MYRPPERQIRFGILTKFPSKYGSYPLQDSQIRARDPLHLSQTRQFARRRGNFSQNGSIRFRSPAGSHNKSYGNSIPVFYPRSLSSETAPIAPPLFVENARIRKLSEAFGFRFRSRYFGSATLLLGDFRLHLNTPALSLPKEKISHISHIFF